MTHAHDHDHAGHDHHGQDHHGHDHAPGHHHHAPASFGRAFAIGIILNSLYVAAEAFYGIASHSLALVADAGHNLSDVLALIAAWAATRMARALPSARFTYGLRSGSILAALLNAVLLLIAVGAIAFEAVQRLRHPEPVSGGTVMAVAAVGIVINGITAWLFASGRKDDLNIRGAFLHMASDALVSAGVVIAGGLILLTGFLWLDPVISLVVSAVIVWGTWSLLRDSVGLALQGVPDGIDGEAVRSFLAERPGVRGVHDLHIWGMSTTEAALTAHLVRPTDGDDTAFLRETSAALKQRFGIGHATFQIEHDDMDCDCALHDHAKAHA
jgi:cobalt-zinc-cadmium efflux system protein